MAVHLLPDDSVQLDLTLLHDASYATCSEPELDEPRQEV
jgi:hypothetical protein